jgi:hypothetical protein
MKKNSNPIVTLRPAVLAAGALGLLSGQVRADGESQNDYNKQYRSFDEVPLGDDYTGRAPYMRASAQPPPPVKVVREVPRAPEVPSRAEITSGLVRMTKIKPGGLSGGAGQPLLISKPHLACPFC